MARPHKVNPTGIASEENVAVGVTFELRTRLLIHWADIALAQERQAHAARASYQGGGPLEEMHASMLTAAAAAAVIDALHGEVRDDVGVPDDVRERWKEKGTARHAQIFETIKRGFRAKHEWSADFEWLFHDQRNAALHAKPKFAVPKAHPVAGNVAQEYVLYSAENAKRAADIMLDVLTTCVERPKPALAKWAADTQASVERLVASRG